MAEDDKGRWRERWQYRQVMRTAGAWEARLQLPTRADYQAWQTAQEADRTMSSMEQRHVREAITRQLARDNGLPVEITPVLGMERVRARARALPLPETKRDQLLADIADAAKIQGRGAWKPGWDNVPEPPSPARLREATPPWSRARGRGKFYAR